MNCVMANYTVIGSAIPSYGASGILLTDYDGLLSVCCDNAQEPWPINLLGHCETSDEKYSNKAYSDGRQWMSLSK